MPEQRIYELMEELDMLLEEKVQDEENRELLNEYRDFEGVTDEQLDAFEREQGIRLPADFRAFYKRKNGSGYGFHVLYPTLEKGRESEPFYLLSLEKIQKEQSTLVENRMDDYFTEEEIRELDPRIKPYLFQKKWITFGMLGGGSLYLMFDFDPTEQGTVGQIIMYVHDPDFVYYVAGTFTELLEQSNRNLRALEAIEY
ncbi:SMI1/KNR4 family protein [Paenibacillus xylanexedens]|uniref:Cell wall assembly regulator SMI1 n=2 Tax=Paenibacillus TaxID=44249 RepID=A0ABS4S2L7_PAEXY|nr:SMI1/KNR4 family protein [Paenibacillus xylanexedens]MBP2248880.1 cell wall assembly regulator SMI1 [Paenibacillus xylanexedens]